MNKEQINENHKQFDFTWTDFHKINFSLENYRFDKYQILQRIGKGSFATVYKGIIVTTRQQVAIKVINLKQIRQNTNPKLRQIKLRLAESQSHIMMMFDSPNIIKCYESFQSQDFKFMILQYCNGGDLFNKIQNQGKIFSDEAISILKQIVNGIGECHRKKIIHRDLKTQNILIHNGIYKIADFGFSKLLLVDGDNDSCKNTTLGTPTTMAPEVKNFEPYGLKADIWSIGVIFFHMLFGKCPFQSRQNPNKIITKISTILQKQQFYEGVRISDSIRKFLKDVLVLNPEQRIGWKQLIRHKIFQEEQQELRTSFMRKVTFEVNTEEIIKLEEKIVVENQENQSEGKQIQNILKSLNFADQILKKLYDEQQSPKQNNARVEKLPIRYCSSRIVKQQIHMIQLNQCQIKAKDDEEAELYQWAKRTYLQCLKTQLIYKRIILAIEKHKLLDLSNRQSVQLMYLLCTRCYNNMSPIYQEQSTHKNSEVLKELSENVEKLYNQVGQKWERYNYLLTQKQNKALEIAADWAKRVILSKLFPQTYDYYKKQRFMIGIESPRTMRLSQQVYQNPKNQKLNKKNYSDYTKEEQIKYTLEYYHLNKSKFLHPKSQECKEVLSYLSKLEEICKIRLQELKNQMFKDFVQKLVQI